MLVLAVISCRKNGVDEVMGIVEDLHGLDGCGYVIKLNSGERLEPVSNTSGVALEPGRRVAIKYKSRPVASICMVGETVDILSLRYVP